jgi:UrcA family protein
MSPNKFLVIGATAGVVLGAVATVYPAIAQPESAPQANEQIIVQAPGYVFKRIPVPGHDYKLVNAEVASITRTVSYADLDLSKPDGAATLKKRVNDTATQICRELNSRFPKTSFRVVYGKDDCVQAAVEFAMPVVNQVITASAG